MNGSLCSSENLSSETSACRPTSVCCLKEKQRFHVMADEVDLTHVDGNDFQKRGKGFFWSDNSSWEICSTISVDTNDSLGDISELNGESESETNSKGDSSWHNDSDQQSDDDHTEEASTSLGNGKEKRNSEKAKAKVSSGTQKGRRAKGKSARKTASSNKNNNTKGKPRKAREKSKRLYIAF